MNFPGELQHTARGVFRLIKEHSEPLESTEPGLHSLTLTMSGHQAMPQGPRVETYAKRAKGTQQTEWIHSVLVALLVVVWMDRE